MSLKVVHLVCIKILFIYCTVIWDFTKDPLGICVGNLIYKSFFLYLDFTKLTTHQTQKVFVYGSTLICGLPKEPSVPDLPRFFHPLGSSIPRPDRDTSSLPSSSSFPSFEQICDVVSRFFQDRSESLSGTRC